jgi:quercetin dioxygenase-like cupin family protein
MSCPKEHPTMLKASLLCLVLAFGWTATAACTQDSSSRTLGGLIGAAQAQDAVKRTPLQRVEYPGDRHATLLVLVEIAPNGLVARHTHPGVEMGYVVEGEGVLSIEGQADRPLKPGDSYQVPAGTPHSARGGAAPQGIIATFAVEKDKPLASPAP